jgi:hypothetical protein
MASDRIYFEENFRERNVIMQICQNGLARGKSLHSVKLFRGLTDHYFILERERQLALLAMFTGPVQSLPRPCH